MSSNKSARTRLLNYLESGRDITVNQAQSRFNIVNVPARISELRAEGNAIFLNEKVTGNGQTIRAYRLGSAKRYGFDNSVYGGRQFAYYTN